MKKIVICNIPMRDDTEECVYKSDDKALPTSDKAVVYPICAYFEKALASGDELKVLLLAKTGEKSHYEKNIGIFKEELASAIGDREVSVEYKVIATDFSGENDVFEELMIRLVDEIDVGSEIFADITYGPKDLPITVFSALTFAEKRLECEIEHIIYGKADFAWVDGKKKPVNTELWDMVALFYLTNVASSVPAVNPEQAKRLLKSMFTV